MIESPYVDHQLTPTQIERLLTRGIECEVLPNGMTRIGLAPEDGARVERSPVLPCLQPDATDSACKCCQRRFYRDEQSNVAPHEPDGWALVPCNPTEAMIDAALRRARDGKPPMVLGGHGYANVAALYRVMLSERPAPPMDDVQPVVQRRQPYREVTLYCPKCDGPRGVKPRSVSTTCERCGHLYAYIEPKDGYEFDDVPPKIQEQANRRHYAGHEDACTIHDSGACNCRGVGKGLREGR